MKISFGEKIFISIIIFLFLIFGKIPLILALTDKDSSLPYKIYSIQKGDTLWRIALSYYGSARLVDFLKKHNNIISSKNLKEGREIKIPNYISYEVKKGDTLYRISRKILGNARKYSDLAEYNDISNPDFIKVGQILIIPLIPNLDTALAEKRLKRTIPSEEEQIEIVKEEIKKEEPIVTEQPAPAMEYQEVVPVEELKQEEIPVKEEEPEIPIITPTLEAEEIVPTETIEEETVVTEEIQPTIEKEEKEKIPEEIMPPSIPIDKLPPIQKKEEIQKETVWPPKSPWIEEKPTPEKKSTEPERLSPLLDAASRWSRYNTDLSLGKYRKEKESRERGVQLPMNSLLQIEGYKSATIEYSKTHYFGKSDINRYRGGYFGSYYSDYYSDYGYGGYDYGGYGGYSSYDSYGSSYSRYGGYGYGMGRDVGFNVDQELVISLHGRIGGKTHVDIDYNDTGRSQFGGMGQKEQKIAVWYEGSPEEIVKKAAFGDIQLNIPSSRFITMNRSLFGAQLIAELAGVKLTVFGTRTKGLKGTWTSQGQSLRAGGGTGTRIMDINYIKERYYAINVGEDGLIHNDYLPIETGSEQIYIDDGIGTNNDSGISTAQGYFDYQYPGDDYSIDYTTGQIEFLKNISSNYKIVVAYKYRGGGGGTVGNPEAMFVDDDKDGVIDEKDDPSDHLGYVVIKESGQHGSELRNVYSLGNRNINRRQFDLSIWRENGTEYFQTDEGQVSYNRIFGLDSDGDGLVDDQLIDFERGILTFPSPRPFVIDDPSSPYYKYRDQLNNEAIYAENPRYNDQKYIIQADYSYQTPSIYLGRLNIIPESEEVILNGRRLKKGTDYIIVYEVGSVEIFRELTEYDKIVINYEYMPFGGIFQQTIAGIWAEYSFRPRKQKAEEKPSSQRPYSDSMSPFSQGDDTYRSGYDDMTGYRFGSDYSSSYSSMYDYGSGYSSDYGSGYGFDYGGYGYSSYGYDSYSSFGSRRGRYSGYTSGTRTRTSRSYGPRGSQGLNLSLGYIYNAGQRSLEIPDVNSVPSRLQAFVANGNWGHEFNMARIFGLVPLVSVKGAVPLSIFLDIESAYSRNNPNSVGYAMIDSMEGAKESSRIPTYKFSWQTGSVPVSSVGDVNVDNRAIFTIVPKDKEASYGNYMKNRDTSAREINPLSRSIEKHQVMEIGYELSDNYPWGSLSHSIAPTGSDFSEYEFLEIWLKVDGDKNVNFNIDFGTVSEDNDEDFRLDSEDLPADLTDVNGDHKIDILDLSKENLPAKDRYKGNGRLDVGEDIGWSYNSISGTTLATVGKDNNVLDTEDLDGDVVLDTTNSYFEFSIPLNSIPSEWIRRENKNTGWMFLSIPIEEAIPNGRSPSWGVIKHVRIWLEKTAPGTALGKLQWYSIVVAGNKWEKGLVVDESGKLSQDKTEQLLVGTKNNHEFEDYLTEYRTIENNKDFKDLHPYVESAFDLEGERKEQALTINYKIMPKSTGYTMRTLLGQRRGDGQDLSKHQNIRLWIHGDGSKSIFIMRLGSNVDDFGAGSPITKKESQSIDPYSGYSSYSYYSYSSYGGRGYYEYTQVIDFVGWRLITIPLDDNDGDGHPDSMKAVNDPTISNISQILLGIRNDSQFPAEGEIWINEIHLNNPHVKTGWARRFNLSTDLANIFSLQAGYAKQDKDFENSAGQTGRSSMYSMGYSTSNYDYNVNTEFKLISWLPISYDLSHRETESIREYGMISSYDSGKTKTDNKTFSISFDRNSLPSITFSYDNQETWNERRGSELSNLYSSDFRYALKSILSVNMNYSHELLNVESSQSSQSSSSSYYYYGRNRDSIIDSGSISLQITPVKSFSVNPSYDVRRELEREIKSDGKTEGAFKIAGRDQRFSLRPTLRQFWGFRPTMSSRYSFSENWFRNEKDASLNTNLNFGINFTLKNVLTQKKEKKDVGPKTMDGTSTQEDKSSQNTQIDSETPGDIETDIDNEFDQTFDMEERRRMMDERMQEERGNWIESEKDELKKKMRDMEKQKGKEDKGIFRRSLESFTFNIDLGLDINDYLRQLKPDMGFFEIINLEPESKYRNRSSRNRRISIRTNVDPFTWASIGFNTAITNRFSKSMGTASNSNSATLGGDLKLSRKSTSFMFRYDMTKQDMGNRSGQISNSISHNPSITLRNNWSSGVGLSLGVRTTFRNQERSGIKTKSLLIAPNFNIDYDLHVSGDMGLPLIKKRIKLDHNLDMSNTFSTMIRREKLGVNRDEKSEQYGTSLDISYNLRERIRATLRLAIDYNHDRVQEGADYLSVSGSLMLRGEFR